MKNTVALGMKLAELSMRDICEELTDLKRDLAVIEDYEKGIITLGECMIETSFLPEAKGSIVEAIQLLREEKQNRNEKAN